MNVVNRLFLVILICVTIASGSPFFRFLKSDLTDLMQAVTAERIDLVKQLLDNHVDVNARPNGGYTALMFASGAHLHDSERQLIELGISVPSLEIREQILQLLLDNGADPNLQLSTTGRRALTFAIYHGRTVSVRDLLEAGAEVNFFDRQGSAWSPLMLATYHCYPDIIELLLSHHADPNLSNSSKTKKTNAKTIASEKCPEVLKLFEKN